MRILAGRSFWGGSVSAQKKTDGCGDYGCEDDTASSRSGHGEKKREQSCRNCRGEVQSVATQGEKQSKKHGRQGKIKSIRPDVAYQRAGKPSQSGTYHPSGLSRQVAGKKPPSVAYGAVTEICHLHGKKLVGDACCI